MATDAPISFLGNDGEQYRIVDPEEFDLYDKIYADTAQVEQDQ